MTGPTPMSRTAALAARTARRAGQALRACSTTASARRSPPAFRCSLAPNCPRAAGSRLRDELRHRVGFEPLDAAFTAVAALLDAAERRFRRRDRHRVDADHAGLER